MKIAVTNKQTQSRPNKRAIRLLMERLMSLAASDRDCTEWNDLTVVLVDDEMIRQVKHDHFGRLEVTDVVSVSYDALPGECTGRDADIVVNVQQALREGEARGRQGDWSCDWELALYMAHGCDHLCGGRDDDSRGRAAMRRREMKWLHELFAEDGPDRLIERP